MRAFVAALTLCGVLALAAAAQADEPPRRGDATATPPAPAAAVRAGPVEVSMPVIVLRVRRPRVVVQIERAAVATDRASRRPTFVDRIARSASGEPL